MCLTSLISLNLVTLPINNVSIANWTITHSIRRVDHRRASHAALGSRTEGRGNFKAHVVLDVAGGQASARCTRLAIHASMLPALALSGFCGVVRCMAQRPSGCPHASFVRLAVALLARADCYNSSTDGGQLAATCLGVLGDGVRVHERCTHRRCHGSPPP